MCRWVFAIMMVLPFALVACGGPSSQKKSFEPHDISFDSADGVRITATLYPVDRPKPAGLVLVHMEGMDRTSWQSFIPAARREGIMCLAIDVRGHGESRKSKSGDPVSYRKFGTEEWLKVQLDIDAAKKTLLANGADPENLALIGAGIMANVALQYGARDDGFQAIVLLSPGLDYKGISALTALRSYGRRPSLLVTSKGDSYSASSCQRLKKESAGLCELREYAGAAHGTDVLGTAASATGQILLWLKGIIGPGIGPQSNGERLDRDAGDTYTANGNEAATEVPQE